MNSSPAPAAPRPLFNWLSTRGAGVLLHPTSLPGDQGIGTLDAQAGRFLDFLQAAGCKYWQLCPLGPTGYGDSPYQCFSAFAGNPYLIDLGEFVAHGLLDPADLAPLAKLGTDRVDFGAIYELKWPLLFKAHERYRRAGEPALFGDFSEFKQRNAGWLEAYAYFRALKDHHGGKPWWEWPAELRSLAQAAKAPLRALLNPAVEAHQFTQYVFFGQWERIKAGAARRGIEIIGDIPIFVAADSADVWANPGLFELDPQTCLPLAVAGVPPDYFSADGQLWGNPLYLWPRHAADNYAWWHARLRASFELYDVVRIDHFRG
ncbi:MAG: 4-alpha-glucanotransferase, partial [Pseudomonadota bacterium]